MALECERRLEAGRAFLRASPPIASNAWLQLGVLLRGAGMSAKQCKSFVWCCRKVQREMRMAVLGS